MGDSRVFRAKLRAAAWRAPLLAFGWMALVEGEPASLAFGMPVVALATFASIVLSPPPESPSRLRAVGVVRLVGFFLVGSLRGGWDVALRALSPSLPLSPAVLHHSTRLAPGLAQHLLTSITTLMPGTLSVDARGYEVRVHVLVDRGEAGQRDLRTLEARIAGAMRSSTPGDGATHA